MRKRLKIGGTARTTYATAESTEPLTLKKLEELYTDVVRYYEKEQRKANRKTEAGISSLNKS
jgi:hypothetical protein